MCQHAFEGISIEGALADWGPNEVPILFIIMNIIEVIQNYFIESTDTQQILD